MSTGPRSVRWSVPVLFVIAAAAGVAPAPAQAATVAAPRTTTVQCGGGISAISVTPAAGFDPLTATDAQLLANNLPARPADEAGFAIWKTFVLGQLKPTAPTCNLQSTSTWNQPNGAGNGGPRSAAVAPMTTGSCSPNWAGNQVIGATYEDAYGTWKVPLGAGGNTDGHATDSSSWVGIGNGDSSGEPLVQGGSRSALDRGQPYTLWWEVYPENSMQTVLSNVHYGDTIYVHIHFVAGLGQITLDDETYGWSHTYSYSKSGITPDGTAEWIFERPSTGGYFPELANASTTFTQAKASGVGQSLQPLGKLPHQWWTMTTGGSPDVTMANPGGISADGLSFTDAWKAFGRTQADTIDC